MKRIVIFCGAALLLMACGDVNVATDPCSVHECRNDAICIPDGSKAYKCECLTGFEGEFCQNETNECAEAPCLNGGTCVDGVGSYSCECAPGYVGANCQTLDGSNDVCEPNPCQNGGTCTNNGDVAECACIDGFTGDVCQDPPVVADPCEPSPCQNGGTCTNNGDVAECACIDGFTGDVCQDPRVVADPCDPNPCQNGGICTNNGDVAECACVDGYAGDLCQDPPVVADPCEPNPCQNGGVCSAVNGVFACECVAGWEGATCEVQPGTTCAADPCKNDAACEDVDGSFVCECPPGFEGDLCGVDIDDCADDPCGKGGECIDEIAGFVCDCAPGFEGDNCECELQASSQCKDNAVVAYDSCGNIGQVLKECSACAACVEMDNTASCDPLGCDSTAPKLVELEIEPASVDVTDGPATIVLRFLAQDDLSGVAQVPCQSNGFAFASPTGIQQVKAGYCTKNLVKGDELDGNWEVSLTIPQFSETGTWTLTNLMLADKAGNVDYGALQTAGLAGTLEVSSKPDTEIPVLTSVKVSPSEIDVTDGKAKEVTVTFHATDNLSGVGQAPCQSKAIALTSPNFTHTQGVGYCNKTLVDGTPQDGTWQAIITIPPFVEPGLWNLSSLWLVDEAGNKSTDALQKSGLKATLKVASKGDTTDPVLKSAKLQPNVVNVSSGDAVVTLQYTAEDDLSGVSAGNPCQADAFLLVSPSGSHSAKASYCMAKLIDGDELSGTWQVEITIKQFSEAGKWKLVKLMLADNAGNVDSAADNTAGINPPTIDVKSNAVE